MKLLLEPSRELPLVQLSLCFAAGAVDDPQGQEGLARLSPRLLRRGCRQGDKRYDAAGFAAELDGLGADLYDYTDFGATSFNCELLSRSLEKTVELIAAMLREPLLEPGELRRLVRQSSAAIVSSRDDDNVLAARGMRRHLFAGHPHARRVSGSLQSLQGIAREDVQKQRNLYGHQGAILALAGDIDAAQAESVSGILRAQLPTGSARAYPAAEPTPPSGLNLLIIDKPQRSQSKVVIAGLGSRPCDADHTALMVANAAFGGTFSARLMQEVRVKRGWSYGASSQLRSDRVRDAFSLWTAPASGDTVPCIDLQLQMLDSWYEAGIDDEELRFCADYLRRSFAFEIDTPKKRLQQKLDRELLQLPDNYHSEFSERVQSVSLHEANAAIRRRIDPAALWVCVVCSEERIGQELRDLRPWQQVLVEPFDLE